jgi:hypothetical protein
MAEDLGKVSFSAEQVTETHRTLNSDHTVTEEELPGMVNVYLHVGKGKLLFTQYKAGKVLEAIDAGSKSEPEPDSDAETS